MCSRASLLSALATAAVLLGCAAESFAQTEACCRPDGNCFNIDPASCQPPAIPGGPGSFCLGDNDGNGVDDACEGGSPSCSPIPGTRVCQMTQCPVGGQECIPVCANYDLATGAATASDCDCRPPFACHVVFPPPPTIGPNPAPPCVPADNGSGTATMPANCVGRCDGPLMIVDGLPPGTTIEIELVALQLVGVNEVPGGSLGGTSSTFGEQLQLKLEGTGALAGYTRLIGMSTNNETHQGPRVPGNPVQTFDTDMFLMQGQLPPGDPDFDLLRITGGTGFGMPSPGHTTLTRQGPPGSNWAVDSFFDITYRIDFVGAPGGLLGGMSGSTTGTIRKGSGSGPIKCDGQCPPGGTCKRTVIGVPGGYEVCCDCIPDTPDLCPLANTYCQNLQSSHCLSSNPSAEACWPRIVFNAAGTPDPFVEACECYAQNECGPVQIEPIGVPPFDHFYSCPGACPNPAIPCVIHVNGVSTGVNGISASMLPPGATVTCDCGLPPQEEGCCLGGQCFNTFPSDCVAQGGAPQGPGVFCTGVLEACCLPDNTCQMLEPICCDDLGGTSLGASSACLGDSNGDGADDACVPVEECEPIPGTTRCSPTACPDVLDRCQAKCAMIGANGFPTTSDCECSPIDECHVEFPIIIIGPPVEEPDNPTGTATMPPSSGGYSTPEDDFLIIDGLPPGTTIVIDGTLEGIGNVVEVPGGSLGGTQSTFTAQLTMPMTGTGGLAGYARDIVMPIGTGEMHSAPRTLGDPEQEFATDMRKLHGQIVGDPDFDLLRITAGTDFGLPSPGQTTLIQLPNGNWAVDSFFDITYRIDFIGAPGGPLAGMSGSTTGTIRIWAGIGKPKCVGGCPAGQECERTVTVTPTGTQICCDCAPVAPDLCPLASPLCANLQEQQCQSTDPNDACFPQYVFVTSQNPPQVMAEACSCFNTSECGPVHVNPLGPAPSDIELSCSGVCPPGTPGECLVHINGASTGALSVLASTVPVGAIVSCDCVDTPPVCPLASQWCANLQTSDCLLDDPIADACWPRAVTGSATGDPNVLACDCFTDGCGPVSIDLDPTGVGYVYSCPGPCPTPGVACQIFFDDGAGPMPTGLTGIPASQVPAGVIVTCDCPGELEEACCLPGGNCFVMPVADCLAQQGIPQGPGSMCSGITTACCLPDGSCAMLDPLCCDDEGGTPNFGAQCGGTLEACCLPDGTCTMVDQACCQLQGGTPYGPGSACLGDSDGDGHDDLCDPPGELCPLATPLCANQQATQCVSDDPNNETCAPRYVFILSQQPTEIMAELCDCFNSVDCGPVQVEPIGVPPFDYRLSCSGACPAGVTGPCEVFIDGQSSGVSVISASQIPAGSLVSCDCDDNPPDVCPLESDWCANFQFTDCIVDDPTAGLCWPQAVGSDVAGGPTVFSCDCFGDGCGPVKIDQDPTGQGFIYSCPGPCPDPLDRCQIHLDDGAGPVPTGLPSVSSFNVPPGVVVTCACPVCDHGDTDQDGDVDLVDFFNLQKCFGQPPVGICKCLDMDGDGDIDLDDVKLFVAALTGP